MFKNKLNIDYYLKKHYKKEIKLLANLLFQNKNEVISFIKYFHNKFLQEFEKEKDSLEIDLQFYFIDNLFWDIEQYLIYNQYIPIINYNELIKISEANLNQKELFIIKSFLGFGIQKGDPLTVSEFMDKYSFAYNLYDIINAIGKYFQCVLKNN